MRAVRAAVTALAVLLLAGCGAGAGGAGGEHQPRNSDPTALRAKLEALMADECFTDQPERVYPVCGKFYVQLVSTENAIQDVLPGRSAALHAASDEVQRGMNGYSSHGCGPIDKKPKPDRTAACAQALRTTRAGLQQVYDGLYPARR